MKTEEDEAFDDLAKKQGSWGGGFTAKRKMAAHKLEGDVDAFERWWYYEGSAPPQRGEDHEEHAKRMCQIAWSNGAYVAAQPAQEPPSEWAGIKAILDEYGLQAIDFVADFKAAMAQPAQEPVREALKLGLTALKNAIAIRNGEGGTMLVYPLEENALTAMKEALAQPPLPVQEPVELLLQLRSALALASAICNAVPNRESGHLGTLVNAQPDGSHGYRQIQEAEAALVKYLETPTVTPPLPVQREWVGLTDEDKSELAKAQHSWEDLCLAVEAKLKEKNNGT